MKKHILFLLLTCLSLPMMAQKKQERYSEEEFRAKKENSHRMATVFLVDDTRLELVTSRTSSGCATSCANRPALKTGKNGLKFLVL